MKRTILAGVVVLAAGFSVLAQTPAASPKGPNFKSDAEKKAVQAIYSSPDPDAQIKAADDLMTQFADTEFKEVALSIEAHAYYQKASMATGATRSDNMTKAQVYGEQVLAINPHSYTMELLVGEAIESGVKEHDISLKDEVAKVSSLLNGSIEDIQKAPKPNPTVTDADWAQVQKFQVAEAHDHLGTLALIQKDWPGAIKEYKIALDGDPDQDAYATRLASAYLQAGQNADAIALCDKLLAKPNLHPAIKQAVTNIKTQASAKK